MRIGTIISLGASGVLGLGALFVAKVMLPNSGEKAQANAAPPVQTVPVVVASGDIGYGARLEAKNLTVARMPAGSAPAGAYSSVEQIIGQAGGAPLALTPISAREIVLPARLSTGGARPSLAAAISPDMRAYTIRVSEVTGVGGHALPGDRVDVVLMREVTGEFVSEVVIQNVRVLAVDLNADQAGVKAALPKTATLEVSVPDVQKLSMAADLGALSLALRRPGATEIPPLPVVTVRDFWSGGQRRIAPPNTPRQASAPVVKAPGTRPLLIVNGSSRVSVDVPAERGL